MTIHPRTTMGPPLRLGLPLEAPDPPADCGVCASLAEQRTAAAAAGDHSRVSDCNVEIRNHHEPRRARRQQ